MDKKLYLAIFAFFITNLIFSQDVLYTPKERVMPMDKESDPVDNAAGTDYWTVFSDKANNKWYPNSNCAAGTETSVRIPFMRSFLVLQNAPGALYVVESKYVDAFGRKLTGWDSHSGWMKKSDLLLSNRCLKTNKTHLPGFTSGIFNKKALVLNTIREGETYTPPLYYSEPECINIIDTALVYQINFVYKDTLGAYLLGEDDLINPDDIKRMRGWVKISKTTTWNHNLAFESNWDNSAWRSRQSTDIGSRIFANPTDANRYYCQKVKEGFGHIPYMEKTPGAYKTRSVGEIDRFPALNYNTQSNVWEVGVVGHLIDRDGNRLDAESVGVIFDQIDKIQKELRKVNVVFVIDATTSILDYRDFIIRAVETTIDSLNLKELNYRFGIALYRDAAEGKDFAFQAMPSLVPDNGIASLSKFLRDNMIPGYNKCDADMPEAVFYGITKAVSHFSLKAGQSNFVILIGDCGNHNRTTYKDCSNKDLPEFTTISMDSITGILAHNDVNLLAYQVHHQEDPSYNDFCEQCNEMIFTTAKKRSSGIDSTYLIKSGLLTKLDKRSGKAYQVRCTDKSLSTADFQNEISGALKYIDSYVDEVLKMIIDMLEKNDFETKYPNMDVNMVANILHKLNELGITSEQLKIVLRKNGQLYWMGYTIQEGCNMNYPTFLDVLLTNHESLYYIKDALEELIPTNDDCMGADAFRTYLQDTWEYILVEQLKYFSENNEQINDLTLYDLSAILTGWGGREEYRDITFREIVDPVAFPNDKLYAYLIDWMITKGHVQSIFAGRNMLTKDFFADHIACYVMEYLTYSTGNYFEDETQYRQIEQELIQRFTDGFANIGATYARVPKFRIPLGAAEDAAETYYWNDSRIFPHLEEINTQIVFFEDILKEYIEKYMVTEEGY